jgi:hypothetical protein
MTTVEPAAPTTQYWDGFNVLPSQYAPVSQLLAGPWKCVATSIRIGAVSPGVLNCPDRQSSSTGLGHPR